MGSKRRTESHFQGVLELLGSKVKSESRSTVSNSSQPQGLYSPWNSAGQNPGVGSLSLLHGIFLSQRSNPGLLHCRQILYQLSHMGSPEDWSGQPVPSPADLPNPGIKPGSLSLQADSLPSELSWKPLRSKEVSNLCLRHCRRILYSLNHWKVPKRYQKHQN